MQQTRGWLRQKQDLLVSVNLSARHFVQEELVAEIVAILEETEFPAAFSELVKRNRPYEIQL